MRGKSAAAATLSMARSPAVTITMIFMRLIPLCWAPGRRPSDAPIPLCLCETPASTIPRAGSIAEGMAPDYLSPRPVEWFKCTKEKSGAPRPLVCGRSGRRKLSNTPPKGKPRHALASVRWSSGEQGKTSWGVPRSRSYRIVVLLRTPRSAKKGAWGNRTPSPLPSGSLSPGSPAPPGRGLLSVSLPTTHPARIVVCDSIHAQAAALLWNGPASECSEPPTDKPTK